MVRRFFQDYKQLEQKNKRSWKWTKSCPQQQRIQSLMVPLLSIRKNMDAEARIEISN